MKEVYCNYNEIEKKSVQKAIFEICLNLNLDVVQIKGNEIETSLWKKYKNDLKNKINKFDPYSDEEEVDLEEDDLADELEKVDINK